MKAKAQKLARSLGAKVECGPSGDWYSIIIDTPQGKVWSANGCHGIYGGCYLGNKDWQKEAWIEALEEMQYGIEPCENKECDTCNEW